MVRLTSASGVTATGLVKFKSSMRRRKIGTSLWRLKLEERSISTVSNWLSTSESPSAKGCSHCSSNLPCGTGNWDSNSWLKCQQSVAFWEHCSTWFVSGLAVLTTLETCFFCMRSTQSCMPSGQVLSKGPCPNNFGREPSWQKTARSG